MNSIVRALSCLAALLVLAGPTQELCAQEVPVASAADSDLIRSVSVGFDGKILLGRWVPISIETSISKSSKLRAAVAVLDGDAVPVRYEWDADQIVHEGISRINGLIRIGRNCAIGIELRDENNEVVSSRRFSITELSENHQFLPSTTRLSLVVGLTDREIAKKLPFDRGSDSANAIVDRNQYFPEYWIGYESVDRLVVITQDSAGLPMNRAAIDGLARWIRMGGFAMFSCGSNSPVYFGNDSGLTRLGVPALDGLASTRRTGSLEQPFVGANQLVKDGGVPLTIAKFSFDGDNVQILVDDSPVLFQKPFGMGTISVLACDVTEQPMASWSALRKLLAMALQVEQVSEESAQSQRLGRVTHNGYHDLSGQLRAAMDQFGSVTFITFTTVALLIVLFILLIGPGDYLFLRRILGRMEWTWITFTLVAVAFCGLAYLLAGWTKSKQVEVNQVEVIDIDASSGEVRGTIWAHMYQPVTSTTDVEIGSANSLTGSLNECWLSWQGLPGTGLGGMQNHSDLGLYKRDYTCVVEAEKSRVVSLPVQNASTRTLTARWTGTLSDMPINNLRQSSNSTGALLGTVTNPLDIPLRDCVVLYGEWAYLLDRELEPGETVSVEGDMREKTIQGYFTRRREQGSDDINVPWDPTGTNLERIMGMMMFFETIGGEKYSTLTNDFQRWLDLSPNLKLKQGQAVLVGSHRQATTPMIVNGKPVENYDQQLTTIRILFPVEPPVQRKPR